MKSWNHLFETAVSDEVREKAVHDALRGRRKMRHIEKYASDEDGTVKKSLNWILHYHNADHQPIEIYDGIQRKKRTIIVPTFEELVVQHCIVDAMRPMFMHGMYEHSYASIPGRGAHKGKKMIRKWINHDSKNCKYILKMDIRHFFPSIPHDRLKAKLEQTVHDDRLLDLLFKIIDVNDVGLPLGFFTSQWIANWYLHGLDHFIKEECHAVHYVRYMDDMVIFGPNKKKLHMMRKQIAAYLHDVLGLEMKDNWQIFRFDYIRNGKHYGRDLDFMGFRFFRDRTILRRSIWYKCCRKARRIAKKAKATIYDIRQMLSYLGWIQASDVYSAYLKHIKPFIDFHHFKMIMSRSERREKKNVVGNTYRIAAI